MNRKTFKALIVSLVSGFIILIAGVAFSGWNETIAKKIWVLKEFMPRNQITENYVSKIHYEKLYGKINTLDEKITLLLNYNGISYDKKEGCQDKSCICPKPPCKKKEEAEVVQNDSDVRF